MAAPTYVNASTGGTDTGGAWTATCHAPGAAGRILVLQVLQDGNSSSTISVTSITNAENLAGTDNVLTSIGKFNVGISIEAYQHLWIGRSLSTSAPVVTGANSGTDDLYWRFYEFKDVGTGATLAAVIENATAGTTDNSVGTSNTAADTAVVTIGVDRLALNLLAVNDDNAVAAFTGNPEAWSSIATSNIICGGECAALAHWTSKTATATRSTTYKQTGAASIAIAADGNAAYTKYTANTNLCSVKLSLYFASLPGSDCALLTMYSASQSNAGLVFDAATSKLGVAQEALWANRTLGPVITTGVWYTVDLRFNYGGTLTIEWVVGGSSQTTHTGSGSGGQWNEFNLGQVNTGLAALQTYTCYFDDVIVDATGSAYPIASGSVPIPAIWTEVAEFAESSGSDGCLQLQYATMATASRIGGGTASITDSDAWGVVGFALIGTTVVTKIEPAAAAISIAGATPTVTVAGGNTLVQPAAATVGVAPATPTVVAQNYQLVTPAAAGIAIAGATPAVGTPVSIAPAAAAITVGTATPTIVAQNWPKAQPAAAAIGIATATPAIVAQNWPKAEPAAAAITIGTATPAIGTPVSIAPGAAAVAMAGATPAVLLPKLVAPAAAAVAIAGATPAVATHVLIQPTAASITIGTATPTIAATQTYTPAAVAVTMGTATPAISATQTYTPAAAAITVGTATPAIATPVFVQPAAAEVGVSTATPTVVAENYILVQPAAAAVAIAGATPTISVGANVQVQPAAAAVSIAGATPGVVAQNYQLVQPAAVEVAVAGATPTIVAQDYRLIQPAAAAIGIEAATPDVLPGFVPAAAAVSVAGAVPSVNVTTGTAIQPDPAVVTVTMATPAISATQTYTPDAVAISVTGQTPTVVAQNYQLIQPAAASLSIAGAEPTVTVGANVILYPSPASVALSGARPLVDNGSPTRPSGHRPKRPTPRINDILADDEDVLITLFAA